jgi:hypothetical protein
MEVFMRVPFALSLTICMVALSAPNVAAQGTASFVAPGSRMAARPVPAAGAYERASGRNNPALEFYGGSKTLAYAPQGRTQAPAPLPVQTGRIAKPFSGVQQAGGVSPYLALDFTESATSLPNYFLLVQPRLQQQQVNQVQQAEYRRMQQQLRKAAAGGAVSNPTGGIPTTGHSAQFMNVGGYYPSLK